MGCKIVVNGSRGVLELPLIVIKWSFIVILCCRVVAYCCRAQALAVMKVSETFCSL